MLSLSTFLATAQTKTETKLLMHNPNGLRIELNISTGNLDIWISPKAGESIDNFDRNFSNRDDHTSVFDKINFPKLDHQSYVRCDYDPFYSKIIYRNQVMHIATLYDYPAVLVWFDNPEAVDLKTDKQDKMIERTATSFIASHPDRGYEFAFAAGLGSGKGEFFKQLQIDEGRSVYARVNLDQKQFMVIAAELKEKNIPEMVKKITSQTANQLIAQSEKIIQEKTKFGHVLVNNDHQLQKLMDINKRIWVSMQDKSGSIRASIKEIYYLIWVRDGGMASAYVANTGWTEPVDIWTNYLLKNPTVIEDEIPAGQFFGQLVGTPINKWEEDGLFYATLSAFMHWTQTGDTKYISGEYLQTLKDANKWLEEYCFDEKMGLFGRYYYCETPLMNSRGHNWDHAIGKYIDKWHPKKYKGVDIIRSYDIYINMLAYSTYRMLAAMDPENAGEFLKKADIIEKNMQPFFSENEMPNYGTLITLDGNQISAEGYGLDYNDYQWALSLTPFVPSYFDAKKIGGNLLDTLRFEDSWFLAAFFCIHASLDNIYFDDHALMQAMNYMTKQSVKSGKVLPMAYAMLEKSGVDVNAANVIRPQPFTMGPWFSSLTNMALRRLPFGIAIRNTKFINGIENYQYKKALIQYTYEGTGEISRILLNNKEIINTFQIPENMLSEGNNNLVVKREEAAKSLTRLASSNVSLISAENNGTIIYKIKGYGENFLTFTNMSGEVTVTDEKGKSVSFIKDKSLDMDRIIFEGIGDFQVQIK